MNRRSFCIRTAAATVFSASSLSSWALPGAIDVAAWDRARIIKQANNLITADPVTVTASHSPRSSGGQHDFFSEADYWWPDTRNPGGPYIRQDGFTNPDNFTAHRDALVRFSVIVPALVAAWKLTGQRKYAEQAALHIRAWFLDPDTMMNPNLEYAQAIFGVNKGRGVGIMDTVHLVEPARATSLLLTSGIFSLNEMLAIRKWFADYLTWLTTSKNGKEERDARNNHGTCWVMQVAEFSRLTGNLLLMDYCRDSFRTKLIPDQVAPDGRMPLELSRTRPYNYSLFNMDVLCTIAQTLSTPSDNLFNFQLADGRGLRKVVAYMAPFIKDKNLWPYSYDVEYFTDLPVRQPGLLFAGEAYNDAAYIALWKSLDPDPRVPEVIRNFPIRQPVLWV